MTGAGRTKGERTRQRILDAAAEVLAEQGVEGASVTAIAARADLRPGSLYFHFPSRTALVEAAIREAVARASARVDEAVGGASGDPVAALRRAVAAHVGALDELGAYGALVLRDDGGLPDALARERNRLLGEYARGWAAIVAAAQEAGALPPGSPPLVAELLIGAMNSGLRRDGRPAHDAGARTTTLLALLRLDERIE
jgi:AcrR family transcriptional regulator